MTGQLPLPLPVAASFAADDLIADPTNAAARATLARPGAWPLGRLVLFGPAGSGKTHMLRATAAAQGWPVLAGAGLAPLPDIPAGAGIALDDADHAPAPATLLHLINLCGERGQTLLLTGRDPPARWALADLLPDLGSRLRATLTAAIEPPSDALLAALLAKHAADRQLRVDAALAAWLLRRLPRSAAAIAAAVARLDQAALATGGRLSIALARGALAALLVEDDGSMADPPHGCGAAAGLLCSNPMDRGEA